MMSDAVLAGLAIVVVAICLASLVLVVWNAVDEYKRHKVAMKDPPPASLTAAEYDKLVDDLVMGKITQDEFAAKTPKIPLPPSARR